MDTLHGLSLVGGETIAPGPRTFEALDATSGERLGPAFHAASVADVDRACRLAAASFDAYAATTPDARAGFLDAVAAALEAAGDAIASRARAETALPDARLRSELGRTCSQLRLFGAVVREGSWLDARIDTADPARKPLPRPDVRSLRRPLGPVVVLGSSNFPLAFSVAGGDTASALAAGNPVIVKAHPLHPGTSEIVGAAIAGCVRAAGLPPGVFALLFDDGVEVAQALVRHPLVRAVGFTGSRAGGTALMAAAAARPEPIPVYAEMGSVNPVIVLPGALRARGQVIAEGLHASFTLGVGQLCTNPGLVLVPAGADGDAFVERMAALTRATAAAPMLGARIADGYRAGVARLAGHAVRVVAEGQTGAPGRAALFETDAARVADEPGLLVEVFGPATLVVRYADDAALPAIVDSLEGQLTATLHAEPDELASRGDLVAHLARKAGRLVVNQFPTGVEVNHAMVHGGPFPATSDGASTSVGTRAIARFSRLVAFQNFPQQALPEELQDGNPRGVPRLVDGEWRRR